MDGDFLLDRRSFVRIGTLALAAIVGGARSLGAAGPDELTDEVKKVLAQHFGMRTIVPGHVTLDVPDVAPDSREVPIFIEVDLPMAPDNYVKAIHVLVDHNPDIYLAAFDLTPDLGSAAIDTRIKMRRSSHVRVIAETSAGELWSASRMVYTTLNGCV